MQQIVIVIATGCLLAGGVFRTECSAVAQEATVTDSKISTPERWLDIKLAAPRSMAVRPDGRRIVVEAGCETVLYDLESGERLHAWTDRLSGGTTLRSFSQRAWSTGAT